MRGETLFFKPLPPEGGAAGNPAHVIGRSLFVLSLESSIVTLALTKPITLKLDQDEMISL